MVPWELKHERNLILIIVVNEALQEGGIYGCTWMKIIDTLHLLGKKKLRCSRPRLLISIVLER